MIQRIRALASLTAVGTALGACADQNEDLRQPAPPSEVDADGLVVRVRFTFAVSLADADAPGEPAEVVQGPGPGPGRGQDLHDHLQDQLR